ncbi:MAG TPA: hypothetical protein PLM70_05015 [Bacteroidales bacterium]|nr:hypothetical protein [Bacteroidales bacterium]
MNQNKGLEMAISRNYMTKTSMFAKNDLIENLVPCQKLINCLKHSLTIEEFRKEYLGIFHFKVEKNAKNYMN